MKMVIAVLACAMVLCAWAQKRQLTVDEFKKAVNTGATGCVRQKMTNFDRLQCAPARTVNDIYKQIPGQRETVRQFAPGDFMRTLDLCASRENNNASDWNKITANRGKLGAKFAATVWTDCESQIKVEKEDCKNAKNQLCAFANGLHFRCMDTEQQKRKAKTLDGAGNDQCNVIEALGDGRPANSKEFNDRMLESRRGCAQKKDETDVKCFSETSVQAILSHFPTGVNVRANAGAQPGLTQTMDMCSKRQQVGMGPLRARAAQTYGFATPQYTKCIAQLKTDEEDCKKAVQILCQHSYGIDMSCQQKQFESRNRIAPLDPCQQAMTSLTVDP